MNKKISFYADTDFILALIKEDDWLQSEAEKIREEKEDIQTSALTVLETVIVLKRQGKEEFTGIVSDIMEIAEPIHLSEEKILEATLYIEEDGLNPFDAFHAAIADGRTIISSDHIYDELDKEKLDLRDQN